MRPLSVLLAFTTITAAIASQGDTPYAPHIEPASNEGRAAMAKFELPDDLRVELVAAEPDLANPVCFHVDRRGRFWVAETFRLHKGVTDNRSQQHDDWLDRELACRTVDDRVAMYRDLLGDEIASYAAEHERIRLLEDTDGDGVVDRSVVFADGFKEIADGIAAGVLEHRGDVFYTCIPKLWRLRDRDGDGRADERDALHDGFGVHTALLGHDMHGLIVGPDGRLYFSIGDRGFHVETDGGALSLPDEGAVLRCNLDGSELEVFARGLRNPQELAFDAFGNLFTGDNNSDGGDRARWVYVVEGGNSGWHIGYQSIPGRGPWNREKLWHPPFAGQAAYLVPPIANFADGPSGLVYDPGTGLPERYRGCFLLCDFRGSSANSGIHAIGVTPKGAGFELTRNEKLIWRVLPTDVAIGVDGCVYLTDWTEGWNQPLKGRIYRIASERRDPAVASTRAVLAADFDAHDTGTLIELLDHRDRRVRQDAQFALAARGADSVAVLQRTATSPDRRMARIHAIWALEQIARAGQVDLALEPLPELLDDPDAEIRAQVVKVLGEHQHAAAADRLIELLRDRSSRVRAFAAHALGKLAHAPALVPLLDMLDANADRDPFLRHAGVMGLAGIDDVPALLHRAQRHGASARLATVVALRRLGRAEVARFLDDTDPLVVLEAARAIHDPPIATAMTELAAIVNRPELSDEALLRRAINANYRVGDAAALARVVAFATRSDAAREMRIEALNALATWADPKPRDRVLNLWRPLAPRDAATVRDALGPELPALLEDAPDAVRAAAADAAAALEVAAVAPQLSAIVAQRERSDDARTAALRALLALDELRARKAMLVAAEDDRPAVREVGVQMLAKLDPEAAVPVLDRLIGTASPRERQNAVRTLGDMQTPAANAPLSRWLDDLIAGNAIDAIQLDLLEAAAKRNDAKLREQITRYERSLPSDDPLAAYRTAMAGGDRRAGSRVFYEHESAACRRCHMISGDGASVGPDLTSVGERMDRERLLESLVAPGQTIAEGFGSITAVMRDGTLHAGILKETTDDELRLLDADGQEFALRRADIETTTDPVSSMPPVTAILSKRELRDLIEFLSQQRPEQKQK